MENCFFFNHKKVSLLFLSLDKPRTFREQIVMLSPCIDVCVVFQKQSVRPSAGCVKRTAITQAN